MRWFWGIWERPGFLGGLQAGNFHGKLKDEVVLRDLGASWTPGGLQAGNFHGKLKDEVVLRDLGASWIPGDLQHRNFHGKLKDEVVLRDLGASWTPGDLQHRNFHGKLKDEVVLRDLGASRAPGGLQAGNFRGKLKDEVILWDLGASRAPGGLQHRNFPGKLLVDQERGGFEGFGSVLDSQGAPASEFPWKTQGPGFLWDTLGAEFQLKTGLNPELFFLGKGSGIPPGALGIPRAGFSLGKLRNSRIREFRGQDFPWKSSGRKPPRIFPGKGSGIPGFGNSESRIFPGKAQEFQDLGIPRAGFSLESPRVWEC
ncbi:PREDICTED: uncharacterized protein LOC108448419 [Corvus brachyrhynchos]|uniref:uncharacterized protein LOC108448419 n=1 Tax=Corvus brachyrhynchos TaxID=85066 RepID=UPI0008164A34|nr:PREDICTED: uncharacterized protein LOC108448419 [Corvus brachyrhynchos]